MTILVGNGTSLLDSSNGHRIDEFQNVCRFNHCVIDGYEKHVGSKTDTWFTVVPCSASFTKTLTPLANIWTHSWQPNEDKCQIHQSYAPYPWVKAQKMNHAMLHEMCDFMGSRDYFYWSTGAMAIWLMLQTEPEVVLTGFDWWDRTDHHYCDRAVRGTLHKPDVELQFVNKLKSQDRLYFL